MMERNRRELNRRELHGLCNGTQPVHGASPADEYNRRMLEAELELAAFTEARTAHEANAQQTMRRSRHGVALALEQKRALAQSGLEGARMRRRAASDADEVRQRELLAALTELRRAKSAGHIGPRGSSGPRGGHMPRGSSRPSASVQTLACSASAHELRPPSYPLPPHLHGLREAVREAASDGLLTGMASSASCHVTCSACPSRPQSAASSASCSRPSRPKSASSQPARASAGACGAPGAGACGAPGAWHADGGEGGNKVGLLRARPSSAGSERPPWDDSTHEATRPLGLTFGFGAFSSSSMAADANTEAPRYSAGVRAMIAAARPPCTRPPPSMPPSAPPLGRRLPSKPRSGAKLFGELIQVRVDSWVRGNKE